MKRSRPTLRCYWCCHCFCSNEIGSFQRRQFSPRRSSSREKAHHMNPYGIRRVSSSLSKIPYSGFSPVRLQTGFEPRPSSNMLSLSTRPAFTLPGRIYTRLKSLSLKRAFFRNGTCVQAELPPSDADHPVQRSLAPQRVMLSHRIILTMTSSELLFPSRRFMFYPAGPCPTV